MHSNDESTSTVGSKSFRILIQNAENNRKQLQKQLFIQCSCFFVTALVIFYFAGKAIVIGSYFEWGIMLMAGVPFVVIGVILGARGLNINQVPVLEMAKTDELKVVLKKATDLSLEEKAQIRAVIGELD